MSSSKHFKPSILKEKLDQTVRNVEIATMYAVLTAYTELTYRDKIDAIASEYHLSEKRIESIITELKSDID